MFQLFKFAFVGLLTAFIFFFVFWLFFDFLDINEYIAVAFAYFFATAFHFFVNKTLTFKSNIIFNLGMFLKYILLLILNYFITAFIIFITKSLMTTYMSIIFSLLFTTLIGFFVMKNLIFKSN